MAVAFLKEQSLGRILAGHPWVYAADILRIEKPPADGGEITVRRADGAYVGNGFCHSKARIPIRIFSRAKQKLDEAFFRQRLLDARALRETTVSIPGAPIREAPPAALPDVCRLVWSEADFLPGLIVDRYGSALVIQTLTLALDQRKPLITELLREIFAPELIVERNDVPSREFEGLPLRKGLLWGAGGFRRMVTVGMARFDVDLLEGQKTGAYLDQASNYPVVGALARDRRVLDCFAYHGGFALHAALGGAQTVKAIEISEAAIAVCRRNAELNAVSNIRWKAANVFDELTARLRAGESFDLIVLDPPSFTRTRAKREEALRGYKEIHLKALRLLSRGGWLATFCCSHHVDAETFRAVVLDAAFDARLILRLRQAFSQSGDHPILPVIPETEYLKGFLFQTV
ncbi:MAG: class I SAM-dependent rRNA methyltransferase [Verrucomicrobia bacterium]|nr:class I SAM-dependent rRNA methyltransferase [Verrucomicrobiota bacterium]